MFVRKFTEVLHVPAHKRRLRISNKKIIENKIRFNLILYNSKMDKLMNIIMLVEISKPQKNICNKLLLK